MVKTEWKEYLRQQAALHPSMQPQDVYKLIYQAAFGAEHLLEDEEAAFAYFEREYQAVSPRDEALYEQISENTYRVNLRAWKRRGLPSKWLFGMFVGSVKRCPDDLPKLRFAQYVDEATEIVKKTEFSFSYEDFLKFKESYEKQDPEPVHHSERYRESENPAYRLVCGEYLRVVPILERMAKAKQERRSVIAIDGRCASGKSTMAQMLSELTGAACIHMDDFFLPMELRTPKRLSQPGGNIHYERFREEVLPFLGNQENFVYRRFDCGTMKPGEKRTVAASDFCVVEGAYSLHPVFGDYADLTMFSDVDSETQLKRIGDRDGEAALKMFKERWIPMEESYFAEYRIKDRVDLVL